MMGELKIDVAHHYADTNMTVRSRWYLDDESIEYRVVGIHKGSSGDIVTMNYDLPDGGLALDYFNVHDVITHFTPKPDKSRKKDFFEVNVNSKWRCKHNNEVVVVKSLLQRCIVYDMESKEHHSDIVYFLNNFELTSEVSE